MSKMTRGRNFKGLRNRRQFLKGSRIMLVLSRKASEEILIGDNVRIIILGILGDKVRLGVEAPREVPVHRREIYDAIHREKGDAT